MYIVNEFGVTHTIPDNWAMPPRARRATAEEAAAYDSGGAAAVASAVPVGPSVEVMNTIAEKDQEIERLKAALAAAQQPATPAATGRGSK